MLGYLVFHQIAHLHLDPIELGLIGLYFLVDELNGTIGEVTPIQPQKLELIMYGEQRIAHPTPQLHKHTHLLVLFKAFPE